MIRKIEFHIGRTSNIIAIRRGFQEAINLATKIKVNIVFYTNHFQQERLEEFCKAIEYEFKIRKGTSLESIGYYLPYYMLTLGKKRNQYKLLLCEVIIRSE